MRAGRQHLAHRVDDGAVARVGEVATAADPVGGDDVGLVLDRSGPHQGLPVVAPGLGPVGDAHVHVGVGGHGPPLVGEAQVVADEQRESQALDLDGDVLAAGGEPVVLAAVAEAVDLAVPVGRAARAGQHQGVVRRPTLGGDLGERPAHPHVVRGRLLDQELRRRTADALGRRVDAHREPGGERLGQDDEPCARPRGRLDHRGEAGEVRRLVLPDDVVLDDGDPHVGLPFPTRSQGTTAPVMPPLPRACRGG